MALHDRHWIEWGLLAFSGLVGVAGIGLARRSIVAQVLSRATAWTILFPTAIITAVSLLNGHTEWVAAALAAGSGGALLLARPMLNTAEAHAQFAPSSFRRWLLGSSTAAAAAGVATAVFGLDGLHWHTSSAIALLGLAVSLLGSSIGVVRMRAWGIMLGALTSVITLVVSLFMHDAAGLALALTAVPGFMMILPVLIAKRERDRVAAGASSFTRVAHVSFDDAPAAAASQRLRVATHDEGTDSSDALDDIDSDDARAPAPHAARLQA